MRHKNEKKKNELYDQMSRLKLIITLLIMKYNHKKTCIKIFDTQNHEQNHFINNKLRNKINTDPFIKGLLRCLMMMTQMNKNHEKTEKSKGYLKVNSKDENFEEKYSIHSFS